MLSLFAKNTLLREVELLEDKCQRRHPFLLQLKKEVMDPKWNNKGYQFLFKNITPRTIAQLRKILKYLTEIPALKLRNYLDEQATAGSPNKQRRANFLLNAAGLNLNLQMIFDINNISKIYELVRNKIFAKANYLFDKSPTKLSEQEVFYLTTAADFIHFEMDILFKQNDRAINPLIVKLLQKKPLNLDEMDFLYKQLGISSLDIKIYYAYFNPSCEQMRNALNQARA